MAQPFFSKTLLSSLLSKLFLLLIQAIGLLPIAFRSKLGNIIGQCIGMIPFREQIIARLQLKTFLKSSNPARDARKVFGHFAALLFEATNLQPYLDNPEKYIDFPNSNLIHELLEKPGPIIALSAHTGNWELLAAFLAQTGVAVVTIGRKMRIQAFQNVVMRYREHHKVHTIWREGIYRQRELVKLMKKGGILAALVDQDTVVSDTSSEFFGHYVNVPSSLIDYGKRINARFVTTFNFKKENGQFLILVDEISQNCTSQEIIDIYNKRLEEHIRKFPTQWVWFHKRWRTQESGKTLSSSEYIELLSSRSSSVPSA